MKKKTKKIFVELYLGGFFLIFLILFISSFKNNIVGKAFGLSGISNSPYNIFVLIGFIIYMVIGIFLMKKYKN